MNRNLQKLREIYRNATKKTLPNRIIEPHLNRSGSGSTDSDTYYKLQSTYTAGTSSTTQTVDNCSKDGTSLGTTKSVTMPTLTAGMVIGTTKVFVTGEDPAIGLKDMQWSSPYLQVKYLATFRRFSVSSDWVTITTATTYP